MVPASGWDQAEAQDIIDRLKSMAGATLPILHALQDRFGYVDHKAVPAIAKATKEFSKIDILVNNAGITKDGLAVRMKKADWENVINTNLSGSFYLTQQVLQGMMRERWGRIVNISSVVGEAGNAGQANYVASKAGLIGLTKSLAQELGSRNITVNAVAPGFIETDMTSVLKDEHKAKITQTIPLGRIGSAHEVAAAVIFLCGEDASYITGNVIDVNGGMYMR